MCQFTPLTLIILLYSDDSTWVLVQVGYPIRKSPDQRLFAPTRGLSQLITSFIVSMCLGIPRTPLVAVSYTHLTLPTKRIV